MIDVTTQPELAATVDMLNQRANDIQAVGNEIAVENNELEIDMQAADGDDLNNSVAEENDACEIGVQATPPQDELYKLSSVLKYAYVQFLRMERYNRLYHNYVPPLQPATAQHCQVMAKIDGYFSNGLSDIDPEIITYLADFRASSLQPLNRFDKIRVSLINLDIERKAVEFEQKRLREAELSNRDEQKTMVCYICMVKDVKPGVSLLFGECGHVTCEDCTREIMRNPNLRSRCGVCREKIDDISKTLCVRFKSNARKEPVCRCCYKPFNDDGKAIKMFRCGHAFHDRCMLFNADRCMQCSFENLGDGAIITLFVRWV